MKTTQNTALGIFSAAFIIIFIVIWAPGSYLLGKWSNYWDEKSLPTSQETNTNPVQEKWANANNDCIARANKHYKQSFVLSMPSSTDSEGNFATYDCYAIPWTKIK